MNIGLRLKELRKNNQLTITQLSQSINSSPGYISDLENNKSLPSIPKLKDICSVFNITIEEFFNPDSNSIIPMHFEEFIKENKDLTPLQLKKLSEFIKSIK